jgi:CheY-like chemotaxis protein
MTWCPFFCLEIIHFEYRACEQKMSRLAGVFGFANGWEDFTLRPMSSPDENAPPPDKSRDPILLVDDEASLLEIFVSALSGQFECVTANSTREADFELRKRDFKVVICDHLMPGGNGMSFLVRAREEYPHMQRILVTGYMKPEMLLRSVNEAALYRYLLKPVTLSELVKVTSEAVKLHDQSVV